MFFHLFEQFINLTVVRILNSLTISEFFAMLNYAKTVLTKVSFSALLFEKELRKALKLLIGEEVNELRRWCYTRFGNEHEEILNRCFVVA
jgi:hypothetical protein